MVARAGAGPHPIPHKQLTADNLADAIRFCLRPESIERAKRLARKIATEQGCKVGARLFHQHLKTDCLRCILTPSRSAVWRIKRTQVRLSAFAACTLANANLLDYRDLKLYRPQEYYTDEGPIDPISGGFTACCRAIGDMALGLVETPKETYKALQMPFRSGQNRSTASFGANGAGMAVEVTAPATFRQSSSSSRFNLPHIASRSQRKASGLSSTIPSLNTTSSSDTLSEDGPSQAYQHRDELRYTGAHISKGVGRSLKALALSPVELASSLTRGSHNVPRLWGDESVRPQQRVTDFKSSMKAMGKDFGYGWYDGITGLVTQPWSGAQKGGAAGFAKGVGKGIIGFPAKPLAGVLGIMSYPMKGAHKEIQKLFGRNVQSYIVASRTAQGYEEWQRSSEAEKEEVIDRWKLVQKYLKRKKYDSEEMMRDLLATQREPRTDGTEVRPNVVDAEGTTHLANGSLAPRRDDARSSLTINDSDLHSIRRSPSPDADEARENSMKPIGLRRKPVAQCSALTTTRVDHEELQQVLMASEAEATRHAREEAEYGDQLKRAMAQSMAAQRNNSGLIHYGERDGTQAGAGSYRHDGWPASSRQCPSYDEHLAGTTQSEYAAQRQEKTQEEKTEEEIVLEYIKKQTLLEGYWREGDGRTEEEGDEDLRRALAMSMQEAAPECN